MKFHEQIPYSSGVMARIQISGKGKITRKLKQRELSCFQPVKINPSVKFHEEIPYSSRVTVWKRPMDGCTHIHMNAHMDPGNANCPFLILEMAGA